MSVRFGREVTGDLDALEQREWLVTNGIGGYASASAAGSLTRGYHGLLVASLSPPTDRRVMLVKIDETVTYQGNAYDLATNRWTSGTVSPQGYRNLQSFELQGSIPVWTYACADALIEKRVWMQHGFNTTFIEYTVVSAAAPVQLTLSCIADNRIFHNTSEIAWPVNVSPLADGVRVTPQDPSARPLTVRVSKGSVTLANERYDNFYLSQEAARGLNSADSHVHVATFESALNSGDTLQILASAEADTAFDPAALGSREAYDQSLLDSWQKLRPVGALPAPDWIKQYVLAADQFVVDRVIVKQPAGKSVIAGYHWFDDWGRDTMISLPGLTLVTGQSQVAAKILRTFALYVSQGMLPNRFPNLGDTPEYNTMDATLWYFQAIRSYLNETSDASLLNDLFPVLQGIVDAHVQGTRYGIVLDQTDGLLRGGEPGVQLTWMDAKVGNQVITPRIGKPVEINALWYSAQVIMSGFAKQLGKDPGPYDKLAAAALAGFDRFWNADAGYCLDVLDGPSGAESHLRPNQLFAVALPESPLSAERQRAVVQVCAGALLTSYGLRSLAPGDPAFIGIYTGDQSHRDASYHQGTMWAWLLGPFLQAHLRVYNDAEATLRILSAMSDHLSSAGLGTASEIFDGAAPFLPKGCIAQAWSVATILESYAAVEGRLHAS